MAMRSIGSISSELCEMQALRDSALSHSAKDQEWQRRILRPPPGPAATATASPRRAYPPVPPPAHYPAFNVNAFLAARAAVAPAATVAPAPAPATRLTPPMPPVSYGAPLTHLPPAAPAFDLPREKSEPELSFPPVPRSPSPSSPSLSASTHAASPEPELTSDCAPCHRKPPPAVSARPIGKIRRHRMTKEEEARFAPEDLVDLRGSTAAKSRKMTEEERDIMLHKRRLRNRQSAARSRDKQRKTISDVGDEVDELVARSDIILQRCLQVEKEVRLLREANDALRAENEQLRQVGLVQSQPQGLPEMRRNGSTLRFSMSSDMLDKIIGGNAVDGLFGASGSSGMLRIPSKLHVSLSTDKLSDVIVPTISEPVARNANVIEGLLDYATNSASPALNNAVINNPTTTTTKLG